MSKENNNDKVTILLPNFDEIVNWNWTGSMKETVKYMNANNIKFVTESNNEDVEIVGDKRDLWYFLNSEYYGLSAAEISEFYPELGNFELEKSMLEVLNIYDGRDK